MKTAVEYLFKKMNEIRLEDECGNIGAICFFKLQDEVLKQAKEIEKKQIIDAAKWGYLSESGEKYYKDKYNEIR